MNKKNLEEGILLQIDLINKFNKQGNRLEDMLLLHLISASYIVSLYDDPDKAYCYAKNIFDITVDKFIDFVKESLNAKHKNRRRRATKH